MSEDEVVEVQQERPRRGRPAKIEQSEEATPQKLKPGIYFGLDNEAAVVIVCEYSKRREMAERLFSEHRRAEGLLLRVPACGHSVLYQTASGIELGWNNCTCGKFTMIKWVEADK